MNKLKITTGQWILCILGIVILTLIAVLPPVLRILIPKDEYIEGNVNPTPSPSPTITSSPSPTGEIKQTGVLVCSKRESDTTGYTNNIEKSIQYSDNKVHTVINSYIENYVVAGSTNQEARDMKKASCEKTPTTYMGIAGYTKVCTVDNETQFTTNEIFDLNSFKDIDLQTPNGIEKIMSSIKLNDDINEVKKTLEESAYVCSIQ